MYKGGKGGSQEGRTFFAQGKTGAYMLRKGSVLLAGETVGRKRCGR